MSANAQRAAETPQGGRDAKELALLFEVSRGFEKNLDLREALGPILDKLATTLGLRRGALCLLDPDDDEINIEVCSGLTPLQQQQGTWRFGEGITGEVIRTGKPILIARVSHDPRFLNITGARVPPPGHDLAFICVPIRLDSRAIGALSADRLTADSQTLEHDLRLLTIISSMVAEAVRLRRAARMEAIQLKRENERLQRQLEERYRPSNIVGNSKAMQRVFSMVSQVAPSDSNALLLGESGTGKELVAHAIHFNSPRSAMPFIKVNCAALPETVIESELFGHERGAFTGAVRQRIGRFEAANGGTIFLDEIGELSLHVQAKLLRVIQEREFERVGGTKVQQVDIRIIAATNQELEERVLEGSFRRDLYYRLNVFPILLPPLRERRTDILQLVNHFIAHFNPKLGKEIKRVSTPAIDMLLAYHWPGNVRELENCVERAMLLSTDATIHGHHLPPTLQTAEASGTSVGGSLDERMAVVEQEIIIEALKSSRGNMAKAARQLGVTERIMGLRVRTYDIAPKRFKIGAGSQSKA